MIYPVRELEQVVHRCVVRYDRDIIVSARQAAGLAVDLDHPTAEKLKPAQLSLSFVPSSKSGVVEAITTELPKSEEIASAITPAPECGTASCAPPIIHATSIRVSNDGSGKPDLWERVGSGKLKWSRIQHGLKAAAQTRALDATQSLVAVSVVNTLSVPVQIVPGQPELCLQTLDDQGRVLQVEPVRLLKREATSLSDFLAPGEKARYVISFEAPILGAKQRLCALIAQTNAADEPIVIELTTGTR